VVDDSQTMSARTRFTQLFLAAVVTAAIAAPAARAGDPTGAQYQNSVSQIEKGVGGGGNSHTNTSVAHGSGPLNSPVVSGLPFTGLDLVALGAVAVALMSLGLVLRRLTVPSPLR
jgi:hypothetical protein